MKSLGLGNRRNMSRKIDISRPSFGKEEYLALQEPLDTGWVTQGPKVKRFEDAFARHHNVKSALAVTSCTTGLHLVLKALGIREGDEVIVPSFTWVATANAVCYCGARPVLADIEDSTFNIDVKDVKRKITPRTRAVIAVHLFGLCADINSLRKSLPENIYIIEDAACAVGARYKGSFAGGLGDAAVFSFHPRKIVTTGEGGMITTNNEDLAETLNILRNHGASVSEEQRHSGAQPYLLPSFDQIGYNYRMTDLQGAIGIAQMEKLDGFLRFRRRWACYYQESLSAVGWLDLPVEPEGYQHSWQSYVCKVNDEHAPYDRNSIMQILQERGISTRPGTHAVHMLGYYSKKYDYGSDLCPSSRDMYLKSMAIPLHNAMDEQDFEYIVKTIGNL